MLNMTNFDFENVWKIAKKIRLMFLSQNIDLDCNYDGTLLSDKYIQLIMNNLAEKVDKSTTNKHISQETLFNTAAEMFTYLTYCPSIIPNNLLFQAHLLQSSTPKEMIIALTSFLKTSNNAADKTGAVDTLVKVLESLKLNQYEHIQIITKGKCYSNVTFGNCTQKSDLS